MLTSSFCCFKGISESSEARLWQLGCLNWEDFLRGRTQCLSSTKHHAVAEQIREARIALRAGLADYFLSRLPLTQKIRVLPHFKESIAYLDIETTGLQSRDVITTMALYSQRALKVYVRGLNLSGFLRDIGKVSMLVTYNGSRFDIPKLRKQFGIDLAIPHLDLFPTLRAAGYKGGLKQIEKQFKIQRNSSESINGQDAVLLWEAYERDKEKTHLEKLVRYNLQDVLSLELIAVKLYNKTMRRFPLPVAIPAPQQPELGSYAYNLFFDN